MAKIVRVGRTVYENNKKVAEYTHGSWYKYKNGSKGVELIPCEPSVSAEYNRLVDALTAPVDDGERAVLRVAQELVETTYFQRRILQQHLLDLVSSRVTYGIKKHGPYDPDSDQRDFVREARRAASNVLVFCCMELTRANVNDVDKIRAAAVSAMDTILTLDS